MNEDVRALEQIEKPLVLYRDEKTALAEQKK